MRSYQNDYAGWAADTARAIHEERWNDIDRAAFADEVTDLSKELYLRLMSRMEVLLAHHLKRQYQPACPFTEEQIWGSSDRSDARRPTQAASRL